MNDKPRGILVVDLGAQYAQLIARRVRESNTWSEIAPPHKALETAARMNLAGIILSGGPASVYADDAPGDDLPEEVENWIEEQRDRTSVDLSPLALEVLTRIRTKCELFELWQESPDAPKWLEGIVKLEERLKGDGGP